MTPAPTVRRAEAGAQMDRIDDLLDRLDELIIERLPDLPDPHDGATGDRPPEPR